MYSSISSKDMYLRPYQQEAKDSIFRSWDNCNSIMLQMPTGTGKTVLFSSIIKDIHNWMIKTKTYKKILIIVHRTELIEQTRDKLGNQYHVASGIISGNYERDLRPQVQIASIQTLTHPNNEVLANQLKVGFVIIDEAHHALAASYKKLWQLYPDARKLGVTATPWRMNHAGFTDLFDILLQSWTIKKFIEKKFLAKFKYYSIRPTSDEQKAIDGIKEFDIEGDYKISAMENAMDTGRIRANLLESYMKYAKGKRGIIYAITREHGKRICNDFKKAGVNIDYIDSSTKAQDRKQKVEQFRNGDIEVLVNVDIFSEGFDCPALDFVQMARPTRSLVKYLQQVGRALRPNGRKQAIILDNVGMFKRFGLPDANRKWLYHFNGSEVEEEEIERSVDSEYSVNMRRLQNTTEGDEEMVLLNGKDIEQEPEEVEEFIEEVERSLTPVEIMVSKLDYLGISHGEVILDKGLFYDLLETDDSYIFRQISIKHTLKYVERLIIPKSSVLGRLCKEFGNRFSQKVTIKETGDFCFEDGISYSLGQVEMFVTDSLDICTRYDEKNKVPTTYSLKTYDYKLELYNEDLQKLLSSPEANNDEVRTLKVLKANRYKPKNDYFCLGGKVYTVIFDSNQVTIKELSLFELKDLDYAEVHSWDIAKANIDSCLYKSLKSKGTKCIRYIKYFGGKYSRLLVEAEDNSGIYIVSFDGETMNCYYDFEVECKYNYALLVNSESAKKMTNCDFIDNLKPLASKPKKKASIPEITSKRKKKDNKYDGFDTANIFYMKQKNGGVASGFYNPSNNHFIAHKGLTFPIDVSSSFSRYQTRDQLISKYSRKNGIYYTTIREFEFDSPSTAACIIKGYSTNGMIEWKTSTGKTLKDFYSIK